MNVDAEKATVKNLSGLMKLAERIRDRMVVVREQFASLSPEEKKEFLKSKESWSLICEMEKLDDNIFSIDDVLRQLLDLKEQQR